MAPEETDEEESQEKVEEAQVSEEIPAWEGTESEETDTIEETPEEEDVTEESETVVETIAREKAIVPLAEEETPKEEPKKKTRHVTWGQAILISVISSFIAFCLAVLLSIGIFGSLNNGLRYATLDQAQRLNRQVESLNSEIGLLVEDLDGLRARLDNLEGISGRVGELELEAEQLSSGIASAIEGIEEIRTQIEEFSESADAFEQFLTGLSDVLDNLIEQPEVP
jgi:methyl-accepting chemotaxis protein